MTSSFTGNKASLLMIYTGGTIGMKQDPVSQTLRPFDFSQILDEVPELSKFAYKIDAESFDPIIDSSDIEPATWKQIVRTIDEKYEEYDGFVVLHGTDTMAYSASVLSFMLEGLTKPVIFTGSQLPIGMPRTDGKENLISAVEIAASKDSEGHACVPEVCICFDNKLLRGNRTSKVDAEEFKAFRSPNLPPLAEAGISIRYNKSLIIKPKDWNTRPIFHYELNTKVSILKIHPGITPQVVRNILCGPETRAVILETYGSGNAPARAWFLDIVKEAVAMRKLIVNVTQCAAGSVNMAIYANGKSLMDCGVCGGYDSTTESMLAKLFYLMARFKRNEDVIALLETSLRGEISK